MKKPLDRISEAYFNEMGEEFGEKVRNRVHWVCENAEGEEILDVGCSQGIISILLGREGKKVLGIDLLKESIDYANNALINESSITQEYVTFKEANFMGLDFQNAKFDSIIMGEILEHVTEPKRFIKKAIRLLKNNGKIVITVPFGINDYFDHKKTYYLMDLFDIAVEGIIINEIKFLGKWTGFVLQKQVKEETGVSFDKQLVRKLEEAFYTIERKYINDIKAQYKKIDESKARDEQFAEISEKITVLLEENQSLQKKLEEQETQLQANQEQIDQSNKKIANFKKELEKNEAETHNTDEDKLNIYYEMLTVQKEATVLAQKEHIKTKKLLLAAYVKEENLLKSCENVLVDYEKIKAENKELRNKFMEQKEVTIQMQKLKLNVDGKLLQSYEKEERLLNTHSGLLKKYEQLKRRYDAISKSKLGNFTLSY
ncbi:class I SAM-dependent methyltransferase, partial [Bacillus cereus]